MDILSKIAASKTVRIEPADYSVDAADMGYGHYAPHFSEGYPGAVLSIGTYCYEQYAYDIESYHRPITFGEMIEQKLEWLLDPEIDPRQRDADESVRFDDFAQEIQDHIWEMVAAEDNKSATVVAEAITQQILTDHAAQHWLVYSPRGFGNERMIYSVRKGELRAAKKWLLSRLDDNNRNEWWKQLTPDEAQELFEDYFYGMNQNGENASAYRQQAGTLDIQYWGAVDGIERSQTANK